jgi:pyridoxamine 5'-phosphate oxidase
MIDDVAALRREYSLRELRRASVDTDPIRQFGVWFAEAVAAQLPEPNAMTVATIGLNGRPAARVLLLKGFDERGFTFFTNYASRKASQLESTPWAALVFLWKEIERQVRIEGHVERVPDDEADAYFASRPRGSQIGAWASRQSSSLASRAELEDRAAALARQFDGDSVPRPPFWGGYRLMPESVEFWQGRASRLHDRIEYTRREDGTWSIERLSP